MGEQSEPARKKRAHLQKDVRIASVGHVPLTPFRDEQGAGV
jgi:hypothetical protein